MATARDGDDIVSLPTSIADELVCSICMKTLENPWTTPCSCTFCYKCITEWLQSGGNTCPNDRNELVSENLIPAARVVTNILDKHIYCFYESAGCSQTVRLSLLSQHLMECPFRPYGADNIINRLLEQFMREMSKMRGKLTKTKKIHTRELVITLRDNIQRIMRVKSSPQLTYIGPNTHKKVMESARNKVNDGHVISCNIPTESDTGRLMAMCQKAVRHSLSYKELADYLFKYLQNNDNEFEWTVLVVPYHSAHELQANYFHKMEVRFGDLSILLYNYRRHRIDGDDSGIASYLYTAVTPLSADNNRGFYPTSFYFNIRF